MVEQRFSAALNAPTDCHPERRVIFRSERSSSRGTCCFRALQQCRAGNEPQPVWVGRSCPTCCVGFLHAIPSESAAKRRKNAPTA
jgi:hypothetical protein